MTRTSLEGLLIKGMGTLLPRARDAATRCIIALDFLGSSHQQTLIAQRAKSCGARFSVPCRHSCRHARAFPHVEKNLDAARRNACATTKKSVSFSTKHIAPAGSGEVGRWL